MTDKVRNVSYESLLAPFYFRAGDFLSTYIQLNTDELGTVRPFQEEPEGDSEEEEEDYADGTANAADGATNQDPAA